MSDSNHCFFDGRLTKAPFSCFIMFPSGSIHFALNFSSFKSLSEAVNEANLERPQLSSPSVWDAVAHDLLQKLQDGTEFEIRCRIKTCSYMPEMSLTKRYVTDILVSEIEPITSFAHGNC